MNTAPADLKSTTEKTSTAATKAPELAPDVNFTVLSLVRERRLVRKIDWRLCTIAGILCSLNLLDSGIISAASVTSIFKDLDMGVGNRYSVAILVYTVASVTFQLPATILVRVLGPRIMFSVITVGFGVVTLCTAFIQTWKQMVGVRILLGVFQSAIFPGLSYLISTWYTRKEQQLRFAFLQSGEVAMLGLGGFLNFGLFHLDGEGGLAGWRWMFLVQSFLAIAIGLITYFWMVDFPENAHRSFHFLTPDEQALAVTRIQEDRGDVKPELFSWTLCLEQFTDPKLYGFAAMFFLLNLVSTSLSYFLPIILQSGMGFSSDQAILLSAPPYFYAIIPVIISSIVGDYYQLRGLVISFNCICTVVGFSMLGFASQVTVRYVGTYLATGAYVSNWAALGAYQSNNICGQWKRATFSAASTACNGLGGIAGAFIVRQREAPQYITAIWVSMGSHILIMCIVAIFTAYFWERKESVASHATFVKMGFVGVYKAVYDYAPQSDGELAISEGDLLYVLEKTNEDDWWRAKKKASGEDDDEPVGLIPNNYIEEAQPTSHARAMYDYTRQTDEELSFTEDAQLEVFDTSDPDWILVGLDGEYGFAPANYIEIGEAEEAPATEPSRPSLPKRPVQAEETEPVSAPESPRSPVQSPAAALAGIISQRKIAAPPPRAPEPQYTPEASDEEEPTPTLPARPVSVAKSPEPRSPSPGPRASPPYNRASFNRSIDDEVASHAPGGFHMYNINEMVSLMGKRKKMPTTLGINIATGEILIAPEKTRDGPEQKWTAEKMEHYSIEGKHVFMELVRPSKSVDFHAGAKDTAQEIVAALGELAGAVRAEGLREVIMAGSGKGQKKGQILYDFMAQGDDEVTVAVGDEVIVIDDTKSDEWWQVRRLKNGKEGVVPSSYVEITGITSAAPSTSGINAGRSTIDQNRLEEERLAKESIRAARKEEESRGSEVGPGMRLPERGSSLSTRESNSHEQQKARNDSRKDNGQARSSKSKPDPSKVRTWTDRSKSFSVEAQFLALKDGKINLHKMNGVKIAVPVTKMSVEDLEYVERMTGVSLDEDKPLSDVKKRQSASQSQSSSQSRSQSSKKPKDREPSPRAGVTIEQPPAKPEYDWFQFFLSCDVAVGLCERYAQAFNRDSMDESVLPDIDATVLRTLGLREGDIIKVMRFLDKKYARISGKRGVSFGGEEVITPDSESSGGLFSGPGGTLRNNTRKGRPAPTVQTNDTVDPKTFSQEPEKKSLSDSVATPLASAPVPAQKDVVRSGFDDDAWDIKPPKQAPAAAPATSTSASQQAAPAPVAPAAPVAPTLTGSMQELSLLSQPLEPVKAQPTAPAPQTQFTQPTQPAQQPSQPQPSQSQPQAPQGVTPSFFAGIGAQQTGLPQQLPNLQQQQQQQQQAGLPLQQTGLLQQQTGIPQQQSGIPNLQFNSQLNTGLNIARQRPAPPQQFPGQSQGSLAIPAPPNRPLSAPTVNQQNTFSLPPLQPQATGYQNSSGYQPQVAPPGQSLNDLRMQQQYTGFNVPQNPMPNMGMVNQQPQNYNQFNNGMQQQNGMQYPMATGMPQQQNFMNSAQSPFADPRPQQFSPIQAQPTGFQSSFPQQQYPQQTGINAFLQPALQPQPTGIPQQNGYNSSFNPPPVPPIPQQPSVTLLVPQKTGPPPPVRFGVSGDTKKLMPQATGRKANLSQATPQNPFGF